MTTVLTVLGLIAIVIAVIFVYAMCLAGGRWQPLVGRCETDEEGNAFYIGDETVSCSKMGVFVIAWMPLPEPYEPDGV